MRMKLYDSDHPYTAQSLNNVGVSYEQMGDDKKALGYKIQALEMRRKIYKTDHPDIVESLNSVAVSYSSWRG